MSERSFDRNLSRDNHEKLDPMQEFKTLEDSEKIKFLNATDKILEDTANLLKINIKQGDPLWNILQAGMINSLHEDALEQGFSFSENIELLHKRVEDHPENVVKELISEIVSMQFEEYMDKESNRKFSSGKVFVSREEKTEAIKNLKIGDILLGNPNIHGIISIREVANHPDKEGYVKVIGYKFKPSLMETGDSIQRSKSRDDRFEFESLEQQKNALSSVVTNE